MTERLEAGTPTVRCSTAGPPLKSFCCCAIDASPPLPDPVMSWPAFRAAQSELLQPHMTRAGAGGTREETCRGGALLPTNAGGLPAHVPRPSAVTAPPLVLAVAVHTHALST